MKCFKEYSNRKNKKLKEAIKIAQKILNRETSYEGKTILNSEELRRMESKLERRKKKSTKKHKRDSDIDYENDTENRLERRNGNKKHDGDRRPSRSIKAPKPKSRKKKTVDEIEESLKSIFIDIGMDIKTNNLENKKYLKNLGDIKRLLENGIEDAILLGSSKVGSYLNSLDNMLSNLDDAHNNMG